MDECTQSQGPETCQHVLGWTPLPHVTQAKTLASPATSRVTQSSSAVARQTAVF